MQTVFIKETKCLGVLDRINLFLKRVFNIIDKVDNDNYEIYTIPICDKTKIGKYRVNRVVNKVLNILDCEGTNRVVLSKYLNSIDIFKNKLYSENISILDGRLLFKYLSIDVINYILNLKNEKIENSEVWILVNDFNEANKDVIIETAKKVKMLNIITNNIGKFKRIERYLYNEYGINLSILNNKRTSLIKAKIIINVDFPEEIINKFSINNKAVLVNLNQKLKIYSKKFNGININYYNISIPKEYKIEGFCDQETYEAKIINLSFNRAQDKIKEDKIRIENLIGNRGIILENEFK